MKIIISNYQNITTEDLSQFKAIVDNFFNTDTLLDIKDNKVILNEN